MLIHFNRYLTKYVVQKNLINAFELEEGNQMFVGTDYIVGIEDNKNKKLTLEGRPTLTSILQGIIIKVNIINEWP